MAVIKSSNIVLSSDIGSVLNAAGGSVNINQPHTFFTSAAKINPAAKWKPTQYNANFDDSNYWKAFDGSCQIDIKSATTLEGIKSIFESGNIGWTYKYWSVNTTYPYRLGDFRNYKTDAKFAIQGVTYPTSANIDSFAPAIIGFNGVGRSKDDYALGFDEISPVKDMAYRAVSSVYWHESDTSDIRIRTYDSHIENPTYQSCFYATKGGKYYICPVLSSSPHYTTGALGSDETLIPIPGSKLITINVTRSSPIVLVPSVARMNYDGNTTCQPYISFRADVTSVGSVKAFFSYQPYDRYSGEYYGTTYYEPTENEIYATKTGDYIIDYTGSVMTIPEAANYGTSFKCAMLDENTGIPIFEFDLGLVYDENLA